MQQFLTITILTASEQLKQF